DPYTIAVAAALYRYMNASGLAWPSVRTLADNAKLQPNTVQNRLKRLESAGLLRVSRRPRGVNQYQATVPADLPMGDAAARRRAAVAPGDADASASRDADSVARHRSSVSPDASMCVTGDAMCVTPGEGAGEPATPGDPVNGGAFAAGSATATPATAP